uniref:Uncharacterized protein n=1 Tax=Lotharella globosa TaxID=91324 RepID=A0A7S4DZB7_9EUKA|mmetsp:Transcript_22642/g.45505  ORF Transcript_22642/g.45505 Transcript_22642/m.45505 type:complete len:256 (-) Transcript_22642:125-892(-)
MKIGGKFLSPPRDEEDRRGHFLVGNRVQLKRTAELHGVPVPLGYKSSGRLMFQYSGVRGTIVTFEGEDMAVLQICDRRGDVKGITTNTKARKHATKFLERVLAKKAHMPSGLSSIVMQYLCVRLVAPFAAGKKRASGERGIEVWEPKPYYTFPIGALKKISDFEFDKPRPLEEKDRFGSHFDHITDYKPSFKAEEAARMRYHKYVRRKRICYVCPAVRMTAANFTCKDCVSFAALERKREKQHKRKMLLRCTLFR